MAGLARDVQLSGAWTERRGGVKEQIAEQQICRALVACCTGGWFFVVAAGITLECAEIPSGKGRGEPRSHWRCDRPACSNRTVWGVRRVARDERDENNRTTSHHVQRSLVTEVVTTVVAGASMITA